MLLQVTWRFKTQIPERFQHFSDALKIENRQKNQKKSLPINGRPSRFDFQLTALA
jgi:hypothetical protein